ncbi:MAG: hypothetical protein COB66_03420 [Coxiella sp. (in: Bacteria)]|nr:MAG: hypothetical protein COB66_03420 [Coxiella sp. (in: g-proteobacteria)]
MKKMMIAASVLATVLAGSVFAQPQDADMANVKAIMEHSHQVQQQQKVQQQQSQQLQQQESKVRAGFLQSIMNSSKDTAKQQLVTPGSTTAATAGSVTTQAPVATTPTTTAAVGGGTVKELESQLSELNHANASFQQQTDQRIDVLNQEHTLLQGKLTNIGQVLGILNQEVTQLSQQIQTAQKQLTTTTTAGHTQLATASPSMMSTFETKIEHQSATQYVLYAILVLLIVIILMLIPRRKGYRMETVAVTETGGASASNDTKESDTKDEYDFMGSEEAIPAKLDLARAYMAMEDYVSARKVLQQVTKKGDKEQRAEAKAMIDKIPKGNG